MLSPSRYPLLLSALLAGYAVTTPARAAMDNKPISLMSCQPLYSGTPSDPALLRFRHEGITNNYNVSKYIVCPLPKDAEKLWKQSAGLSHIFIPFKQELGGAPAAGNACILAVGSPASGTMKTSILMAEALDEVNGLVVFDNKSTPEAGNTDAATLICLIAAHNTLQELNLREEN